MVGLHQLDPLVALARNVSMSACWEVAVGRSPRHTSHKVASFRFTPELWLFWWHALFGGSKSE